MSMEESLTSSSIEMFQTSSVNPLSIHLEIDLWSIRHQKVMHSQNNFYNHNDQDQGQYDRRTSRLIYTVVTDTFLTCPYIFLNVLMTIFYGHFKT